MIMKSKVKTQMTGKTILIAVISILLVLTLCLSGCKNEQQENVLAGKTVPVAESIPAQVKDTSVSPSKQAFDLAVSEPDLNKAMELCKALEKEIRKEWCFIDVAQKADSASAAASVCNNIVNDAHKTDCLKEAGSRFQDSSLCDAISDSQLKALCVAEARGSCDMIEDEQDKALCMESLAS